MLGSLLKIATLPLDAVNRGLDLATGGDGDDGTDIPLLGDLEELRDELAEDLDDIL